MFQNVVIGFMIVMIVTLWIGMNKMHKRMLYVEKELKNSYETEGKYLLMFKNISKVLEPIIEFQVKQQQSEQPINGDLKWTN